MKVLVLSGGGALGAFQASAEAVLREEYGYKWDAFVGTSAGALNAAMLASGRTDLMNLWTEARQIGLFKVKPLQLFKTILGKSNGIIAHHVLADLVQNQFDPSKLCAPLRYPVVSLLSGNIQIFNEHTATVESLVSAASIPGLFETKDAYVDGALRENSPLSLALEFDPTEVILINCRPRRLPPLDVQKWSLLRSVTRAADIVLDEALQNDIDSTLRINDLVKQASSCGYELVTSDGRPYKSYKLTVIEPHIDIGSMTDFSQEALTLRTRIGQESVYKVMNDAK